MYSGVLLSARRASLADVPVSWKSIDVKTRKRTKRIAAVHFHIIVVPSIDFPPKKHLEGIRASEKRGERRVRISMKGVGEVTPWPVRRPSASFKT